MYKKPVYTAVVMPRGGIGDASSGSVAIGDIKVGYYLNNEGKVPLNLYVDPGNQSSPAITIQPGSTIGQVMSIIQGPNGNFIYFDSADIESETLGWFSKITNYVASDFLPKSWDNYQWAGCNFSDLQNVVFQDQVITQKTAAANNTDNSTWWQKLFEYWWVPVGMFIVYEASSDYKTYKGLSGKKSK